MRFSRPAITPPENTSAPSTNSTIVLRNDPPPILNARDIRAPKDPFDEFVENMKLLARLYNGITLVNGLIDGKIPPKDAIAELLRMGSLTPDVLAHINSGDGKMILDSIMKLSTAKFEESKEVTEAENNIISMFTAFRKKLDFQEVDKVGTDKNNYKAELSNLMKTQITVNDIKGPLDFAKSLLRVLTTNLDSLGSDKDPSKAATDYPILQGIPVQINFLLPELAKYKNFVGYIKALKDLVPKSEFLEVLIAESTARNGMTIGGVPKAVEQKVDNNSVLFTRKVDSFHKNKPSLGHLKSFVEYRQSNSHHDVKHTAGFPNGGKDLNSLAVDATADWLQKRINGNQKTAEDLRKGLSPFDGIKNHLATATNDLEPANVNALESTGKVLSFQLEMADQKSKETSRNGKLQEFHTCFRTNKLGKADIGGIAAVRTNIEDLNKKLKQLSDLDYNDPFPEFVELQKILTFKDPTKQDSETIDMVKKLREGKDVGAVIEKLQKLIKDIELLVSIVNPPQSQTSLINQVHDGMGDIDSYYSDVQGNKFKDLMKCVTDNVGVEGKHVVKMIELIRTAQKMGKDSNLLKNAEDYLTKVFASTGAIAKAEASIKTMKKVAGPETKALALLKNPNSSQNFGQAVQGLVTIHMLHNSQTELKALTGGVKDIRDAAANHQTSLTPDEYNNIKALEPLGTNLNTMLGEIDTVKGSVAKLGETNLEVNKAGFTAAANIKTGIAGDMKKMKAAIQSLKSQQGLDPAVANKLTHVETSLDILAPVDFNFNKYRFPSAGAALKNLDLLFVDMNKALATTLPPLTSPAPTPSGGGGGGGGVNALTSPASLTALVSTTEASSNALAWGFGIGVPVVLVVAGSSILGYCFFVKKKESEAEELARLEKYEQEKKEQEKKLQDLEAENEAANQKVADQDKKIETAEKAARESKEEDKKKKDEELAVMRADLAKFKAERDEKSQKLKAEKDKQEVEKKKQEAERLKNVDEIALVVHVTCEDCATSIESSAMTRQLTPVGHFRIDIVLFTQMNEAEMFSNTNEKNLRKRRYRNIYCIDRTAVKIFDSTGHQVFIHANVLQMKDCKWIMAQAPLDGTEGDSDNTQYEHWMMIDQMKVALNIQLCDFVEKEDVKCSRYYPETLGETMTVSQYTLKVVQVVDVRKRFTVESQNYKMVRIEYTKNEITKTTDILRYVGWGDHETPETDTIGEELIEFADSYAKKNILVHCSAGVGRTGCLTGIKKGVEMCETKTKPGYKQILTAVRECRYSAVQTENQILYMMLTISKILKKRYPRVFSKGYPALLYFFEQNKQRKYKPLKKKPEKADKDEPTKDKDGKSEKKVVVPEGEKKQKKPPPCYEYKTPADAEDDMVEMRLCVQKAEREHRARVGGGKSIMKTVGDSFKSFR